MKLHLSLASIFLGFFAMADLSFAAGRGGFQGGGGGGGGGGFQGGGGASQQNAPPAGSNNFRSADPPPAPPAPPPSFSRQPSQGGEHIQRSAPVEDRRPQPPAGSAAALPSMNMPVHQNPPNSFRNGPSSAQPPGSVPRPPGPISGPIPGPNPRPPHPGGRPDGRDDFLGLHDEHASHNPSAPNRVVPPSPGSNIDRNAIVTPGRSFQTAPRVSTLPNPPGKPERTAHPALPDRWKTANEHFSNQLNQWTRANSANLAAFEVNRGARWNQIRQTQTAAAWRGQYRTPQYQQWRHGVWDYRRGRAEEIWDRTQNLHENLFDNHWWATCWWRHRPWVVVVNETPWWWWNPATWSDESVFFGADLGTAPSTYDPGTNVFYDGDNYDIDGRDYGNAEDARNQAIALANPQIDEIPVPEPSPEGQPQQWLPLGAWALTQQEQGDAVLFFQLSVNRDGIVAGGYKNALTGDEQPVIGGLDKRRQRVAWHIANAPQTVFETGLSSLDYDVASVFVHFNGTQTQTWLLVRLPSPEMPPGPVKVPGDTQ